MDIESFSKEYEPSVKEWFKYNNWAKLDFTLFWQNFLIKINSNEDLSKYSKDHESTAQFKTWLERILKNFYIDEWRKLQAKSVAIHEKYESLTSDGTTIDDARVHTLHEEIEKAEEKQLGFDWDKIIHYVNNEVHSNKSRVIFKLKLYHQKYLPLNEDDYLFIEQNSDLSKNDIDQFLLENQKQPYGLRNEDISTLLKIKIGSISTTHARVRILLENSYKELREG